MKVAEYVNDGSGNMVLIAPEPLTVTFGFCPHCKEWEAVVAGAESGIEAAKAITSLIEQLRNTIGAKAEPMEGGKFKVMFLTGPTDLIQ